MQEKCKNPVNAYITMVGGIAGLLQSSRASHRALLLDSPSWSSATMRRGASRSTEIRYVWQSCSRETSCRWANNPRWSWCLLIFGPLGSF